MTDVPAAPRDHVKPNPSISGERWQRVRPIVVRALQITDEEIPLYLDRMTDGDRDLRHDVEKVLRACRGAEVSLSFLDSPVREFVAPLFAPEQVGTPAPEFAAGSAIGPYVVEGRLGSGGMGVVYLARDPVLDRSVAVKLLPPWLASAGAAKKRLAHEAKAASALEHPNVGVVYGFGEMPDGRPYMAMAHYKGETLRDRIERGQLDLVTCTEIAAQMTGALSAAHDSGIVHRDVKPGNVIVTPSGQVKVVDFGAAMLADDRSTVEGGLLGTVAYMSPEQTRGDAVDQRTDVWSLGVVLYEMLTGTRPFRGASDRAVIHAIRHDIPQPPRAFRPDIGAALERLVSRCMEKDPKDRYTDAGALHQDLIALREGIPTRGGLGRLIPPRLATAVAVAIAGIVALAALLDSRSEAGDAVLTASTIAVLPFTVSGPDIEEWREGMVTLLSTGLDGAGGLRAIDSRTVVAQWDLLDDGEMSRGPDPALQIARQTGARYALTGTAVSIGPALRLTADVYRVDGAERLGQIRVEGSSEDVLDLVDRLAIDVLRVLLGKTGGEEVPGVDLASLTTSSLPALKAFLDGDRAYRGSDFAAAVEAYERAVAEDSTFALAYLRMIDAYGWLGAGRRREEFELAARFRERLPARERLFVESILASRAGRPGEGLELILQATSRYPDAAVAWYYLGENYYHNPQTLASLDETEEPFRRAVELEPRFAPYRIHLVDLAFQNHPDSSRVAEELSRYVALTSEKNHSRRSFELGFALAFGDSETRSGALAALDTVEMGMLTRVLDFPLKHPRFHDSRRAVLKKWIERKGQRPLTTSWDVSHVSIQLFQRGRMRAYLADLDAGRISPAAGACDLLLAHHMGVPVPEDRLESMLAIAETDTTTERGLWCRTMYATERGRWADNARAIRLFRDEAQRVREQNPSRARAMEAAVRTLEAYAAWRRQHALAALRRLEVARLSEGISLQTYDNLHFVTGALLLELDRPREALRYFQAIRWNPLATYHMGRAYEKLGAVDDAREAYSFFVSHWGDADPELQPLVQRAREAAMSLGGRRLE